MKFLVCVWLLRVIMSLLDWLANEELLESFCLICISLYLCSIISASIRSRFCLMRFRFFLIDIIFSSAIFIRLLPSFCLFSKSSIADKAWLEFCCAKNSSWKRLYCSSAFINSSSPWSRIWWYYGSSYWYFSNIRRFFSSSYLITFRLKITWLKSEKFLWSIIYSCSSVYSNRFSRIVFCSFKLDIGGYYLNLYKYNEAVDRVLRVIRGLDKKHMFNKLTVQ